MTGFTSSIPANETLMSGFTCRFVLSSRLRKCHTSTLETPHQVEVALPAHSRRAQQNLNDEYWNLMIRGNDQWPNYTGLRVDDVISALTVEFESILLEYCD